MFVLVEKVLDGVAITTTIIIIIIIFITISTQTYLC